MLHICSKSSIIQHHLEGLYGTFEVNYAFIWLGILKYWRTQITRGDSESRAILSRSNLTRLKQYCRVMFVPGSRDAPCRETNLRFRYFKSFLRKSTKFLSIFRYSSAISALGNHCATRKIIVASHAVNCFVDAVDRRSSCFPLLNRVYQSFFKFRST